MSVSAPPVPYTGPRVPIRLVQAAHSYHHGAPARPLPEDSFWVLPERFPLTPSPHLSVSPRSSSFAVFLSVCVFGCSISGETPLRPPSWPAGKSPAAHINKQANRCFTLARIVQQEQRSLVEDGAHTHTHTHRTFLLSTCY